MVLNIYPLSPFYVAKQHKIPLLILFFYGILCIEDLWFASVQFYLCRLKPGSGYHWL